MSGSGSGGESRDFAKAWNRDAHLPKLDPRLLPALRDRCWTPAELTEYCREKRRNRLLHAPLVERWLVSAQERGLARSRDAGADATAPRWEATDRGRSQGNFIAGLSHGLGGLSGALGIVSFFIALYAERIPDRFRPVAIIAAFYLVCLLIGVIAGRVSAERSRLLLKKVVERERDVQRVVGAGTAAPGPEPIGSGP